MSAVLHVERTANVAFKLRLYLVSIEYPICNFFKSSDENKLF